MPADWSRFKLGNVPLCSCFAVVVLLGSRMLASCRVRFLGGRLLKAGGPWVRLLVGFLLHSSQLLSTLLFVVPCLNKRDINWHNFDHDLSNTTHATFALEWRQFAQTRPLRRHSSHTTNPRRTSSQMASRPVARPTPTTARSSLTLISLKRLPGRQYGRERSSRITLRSGHTGSQQRRFKS